jgi:DNA-binding MarR family transcriptional regulator
MAGVRDDAGCQPPDSGCLKAVRVAVDARNLVAVLDQLTARNLVVREMSTSGRRRRTVRLTSAGTALAQVLVRSPRAHIG